MHDRSFRVVSLILPAALIGLLLVMLGRVAQLQLRPGAVLQTQIKPRESTRDEPPLRGSIVDRRSRVLASTRIGHRVIIDPTTFTAKDRDAAAVRLAHAVGLSPDFVGTRINRVVEENARRAAGMAVTPIPDTSDDTDPTSPLTGDGAPGGGGVQKARGPIRYLPIGDVLDDDRVRAVRDLLADKSLGLRGVLLEKKAIREYPSGAEVASIVGRLGYDGGVTGTIGVEMIAGTHLKGDSGSIRYVRDSTGRPLWMEPGSVEPATPGQDLRLSIDLELQRIAHEELQRRIEEVNAAGGRLVMADPNTGEVLAMVDIIRDLPELKPFPWVDAAPASGRTRAAKDPEVPPARYITIPADENRKKHPGLARNRCIEDIYEPGSTFKPFVWSTVTELQRARLDEVFNTHHGKWQMSNPRRYIEDVTQRPEMTWRDVLVLSSNIGMIQGAGRLTPAELHACVLRFGFGSKTGLTLAGRTFAGEAAGVVTPLSRWSRYTHTSVPWGHEVAVTPMQMVRAFSVFARSGEGAGTLPRMRLDAVETSESEGVVYRVLPANLAVQTREIMRDVVVNMEKGMVTRKEEIPEGGWRYSMFGKSGTADIPISQPPKGKRAPKGMGFYPGQLNTSFIAGAPTENPKLVVLVVIDDPGQQKNRKLMYGSATAGPAVRRVIERSLTYLGVPPSPRDPAEASPTSFVKAGQ